MLHVTNGQSAVDALRAADIAGETLSWLDALTDGPVPEGLTPEELRAVRAAFIAERGWAPREQVERDLAARDDTLARFRAHEEVVLWFEHDLFDQLQLLQLLDWFSSRPLGSTRLTLVASDSYLGPMGPDEMRRRFDARERVQPAQIILGSQGWAAFRSPDPRGLESFVGRGEEALRPLPFLRAALHRALEELPDTRAGLARTERQALEAIAAGRTQLGDLFRAAHHEREEAVYLGDSSFAAMLETLGAGEAALVTLDDGDAVRAPRGDGARDFWSRHVRLTDAGRAVLAGREDRVRLLGLDRWLGGVHLFGHDVPWRWDGTRVVEGLGPGTGD